MTRKEAVNWLINLSADIGKAEYKSLWHYEQALSEIRDLLESESQAELPDTNVGDIISRQAALNPRVDVISPRGTKRIITDTLNAYREYIEKLPSAEPQIIRCKDCKHHGYDRRDLPYCSINDYGYGWKDEDFCSYAERKGDG